MMNPMAVVLAAIFFFFLNSCSLLVSSNPFDDYVKIVKLMKNAGNDLPNVPNMIPKIAVIGVQSAGKSSFIEYFTKIPISFIGKGTATRCPVEYELHYDSAYPDDPVVQITLPRKAQITIPFKTLSNNLEAYMQSLGRTFSSEPVHVAIYSSKVVSIVFTDIPGLITNPQDATEVREADEVAKIVADYARDPSYKIVAVLKSTEEYTTNTDISLLNRQIFLNTDPSLKYPPRPDWEASTVKIVNRINEYLPNTVTADEANNLLGSRSITKNVFFVSLKPDKHWERAKANFDEIQQRILSLDGQETQLYQNWKATIPDIHKWDSANDARLGLKRAEEYIFNMFHDAVQTFIKTVKNIVRHELDTVKKQLVDVLAEESTANGVGMEAMLDAFIHEFMEHIQKVQNTESMSPTDSTLPKNSYHVKEFGQAIDTELLSSLSLQSIADSWKADGFNVDIESLKNTLSNGTFIRKWSYQLLGLSSYNRLLEFFTYTLISHIIPSITTDEIEAAAPDGKSGVSRDFPVVKLTTQIARREVINAKRGIKWLEEALRVSSNYCLDTVLTHLLKKSGRYNLLAANDVVYSTMATYYQESVKGLLYRITNRWNEDIEIHSATIQADLPTKTIFSLLLIPQEELVLGADRFTHQPAPPSGQVDTSVQPIQGDVCHACKKKNTEHDNNARWAKVLQRLFTVRSAIQDNQNGISASDFIDGGYVSVPTMDKNNYNRAYLESAATEYYLTVIFKMIGNLESCFEYFFINKIASSASFLNVNTLHTNLMNKKDEILNIDKDAIRLRKEKLLDQKSKLDNYHKELSAIP